MGSDERYRARALLRRYPECSAVSCESDQGPRLLLEGHDASAGPHLEQIAIAHKQIDSPHIAKVVEHARGDKPHIVFDCDAVLDVDVVVDAGSANGLRMGFPASVAFNDFLLDASEAAHLAEGGPFCFAALGWRSVLVSPNGKPWLFGVGHNFPLRLSGGQFTHAGATFVAPEVVFGNPPTPTSDVHVVHSLMRSLLPYAEPYIGYAIALTGAPPPELEQLRDMLIALSADALAAAPEGRIRTIAELRARYRAARAIQPSMPEADYDGLCRLFASVVDAIRDVVPDEAPPARHRVGVNTSKRTMQIDGGDEVDLSRRGSLWRVWARLVGARQAKEGALSLDELLEAGWPDEQVLPDAARARVYVAVSTLRKMGLKDCVIRRDDGYLIAPDVQVEIAG